jgi:hypothetical protein
MLLSQSAPSLKSASMPLIQGEPSRRTVATVLCLFASKIERARAASSGASASSSRQLATG